MLYNKLTGFQKKRPSGGSSYATTAVDFSSGRYERSASIGSDGKLGAFSVWIKPGAYGQTFISYFILAGSAKRVVIKYDGGLGTEALDIRLYKTDSNFVLLHNNTLSGAPLLNVWSHIAISWDMANSSNYMVMINGVNKTGSPSIYLNTNIDYTAQKYFHGNSNVCLADLWFSFGENIDFTNSTNLERFRSSAGKPVDLGVDGSLASPTSRQPEIFVKGPTADFGTNLGSGGDFTSSGTVIDCSDNPSD